jgi:hypothetical protein
MDESEFGYWEDDEIEPDFMDVYGTNLDTQDREEIVYETDEEGFYIMR